MGDKGEILDIKIADIKATAPHFEHESVALAHALTKLRTALAAAGSPWGDDDQGTAFHQAYGPHVTQIEHAAQILVDGLASIHTAMVDMADGHIDNERLVRSMFSRIGVPHDTGGTGG
ncbi:hypothetical protein [Streptomyces sp. YU58]|uniref:hypothetical protein n=1 Tax=Streptomyces sp. SX92 TaxID=3158972 RepID=UPI0027B881E2|nr:hypothetical protein [Streptomyces coralus]WLW52852.1 hypothetical protein QU709_16295 [Streptomyces coralus]